MGTISGFDHCPTFARTLKDVAQVVEGAEGLGDPGAREGRAQVDTRELARAEGVPTWGMAEDQLVLAREVRSTSQTSGGNTRLKPPIPNSLSGINTLQASGGLPPG